MQRLHNQMVVQSAESAKHSADLQLFMDGDHPSMIDKMNADNANNALNDAKNQAWYSQTT